MSEAKTPVDLWVEFINTQKPDLGRACLADDVHVVAYLAGATGAETIYSGVDAVLAWAERAPQDRYAWEVTSVKPGPPDPRLPASDTTFQVQFVIRVVDAGDMTGWTNEARWIIGVTGDAIVGVVYEPNDLTQEQWDYAQKAQDASYPDE